MTLSAVCLALKNMDAEEVLGSLKERSKVFIFVLEILFQWLVTKIIAFDFLIIYHILPTPIPGKSLRI